MDNQIKLGCAPIAWTNDDMPELGETNSFEQCISEMALAGYKGTEIGNKYPRDPEVLKSYLEIRGLEVASAWFSAFLTTQPLEEVKKAFIEHRDFLHAMGAEVIVVSEQGNSIQGQKTVPLFEQKPVFNEKEWKRFIDGLEELGDLAAEKGMSIVYHHHMGTGVQTTEEIDRLMVSTDPAKVSLLFDTGHLVFSGEDPLEILERYFDRIKHVHFKDVRRDIAAEVQREQDSFLTGVKKGAFTVPGDGMIDFAPIMNYLARHQYTGWIVVEAEQDPDVCNAFEYALKAKKHIDALLHKEEVR
ncbi:myo-inosose-2 dehydratase [Halobacillus kuroshimensis]|uniref:Inosose dehydratase n=1 Tax=Halobacillus kuroshimensis TaxID=302481 RepID=A0ABS3DWB7_9BACI|nr:MULTISPECIES: myo-inosose-2 dehydratase [Halobacillus]MBN8235648.1 myo-inosose-2 dehydratase [Halobacillus kuroshimensis]